MLHEGDTKPITSRTKLIIRGATTHFKAPFSRSILEYCRQQSINYVVITTSMASQGLRTYLKDFRSSGDAVVEEVHCFRGDEDSLVTALSGKDHTQMTREEILACFGNVSSVVKRIRRAKGRVLILCQVGRNRSFTTGFVYYLVYYGAGKSVVQNLVDFKEWSGLSYDKVVQRDGSQRLDEQQPSLPWMRDLARLFEGSDGKVSAEKIKRFMETARKAEAAAAAVAAAKPKRKKSSSKRGRHHRKSKGGSRVNKRGSTYRN
jgi:hypothetical protein